MAAPYKFQKGAWNASKNNSEKMYRTDLRIGEVIYEFVSHKVPSFWLISLNGFDFFCCVTVKTISRGVQEIGQYTVCNSYDVNS